MKIGEDGNSDMIHIRWLVLDMGVITGIKLLHRDELWGRHWKVWMNLMIMCGSVRATSAACGISHQALGEGDPK